MPKLEDIAPTNYDVPPSFGTDPRGRYIPNWHAVVTPRTIGEVQALVRYANETNTAIVPFGGGTGLVGGQFYTGKGRAVALSMAKFNSIESAQDSILCGAGVILDNLQDVLNGSGRRFPLSLASSGSAQIGGLIATNAGGVNVIRHGTMGELVAGLTVVLPNGEIIDRTNDLKKDNTGYAIDRFMIGAEGTLGIITQARLKTVADDREQHVVLMPVASPTAALALLGRLRALTINAFELIDGTGLEFREIAGLPPAPIGTPQWSVLFEIASPIEELIAVNWSWDNAIIASDARQTAALWAVRETIPEANRHIGAIASHDISLPIDQIPHFLSDMGQELAAYDLQINAFGHLGDGNLHYNLFPVTRRDKADYDAEALTALVHARVVAMGGSISAEHGIGRYKAEMLTLYGYDTKLNAMHAIKGALDPNNIMNPGVFFGDTAVGTK